MSISQVFAELNALASAGVVRAYAVGGAIGALYYLEPASTQDVNVFVLFRPEDAARLSPLAAIYDFFASRGATPEGEHVVIGGWPVQILPADDLLLDEAVRDARQVDVEGVAVRVMSAEHLAAAALDTGRAKDRIRLGQFLAWDGFDRRRFETIVERHPKLVAKWARYRRQFKDEAQPDLDPDHPGQD